MVEIDYQFSFRIDEEDDLFLEAKAVIKDAVIAYASIQKSGEVLTLEHLTNNLQAALGSIRNTHNTDELAKWRSLHNETKSLQNQLKGLGRSLLYKLLNYGIEQKLLKLEDTLNLEAGGWLNKSYTRGISLYNMIPLARYYEKLGFVAEEGYISRYQEAFEKIEGKFSGDAADRIAASYDVKIEVIPMSSTVGHLINTISSL